MRFAGNCRGEWETARAAEVTRQGKLSKPIRRCGLKSDLGGTIRLPAHREKFLLLVDERPEEVTDLERETRGQTRWLIVK